MVRKGGNEMNVIIALIGLALSIYVTFNEED